MRQSVVSGCRTKFLCSIHGWRVIFVERMLLKLDETISHRFLLRIPVVLESQAFGSRLKPDRALLFSRSYRILDSTKKSTAAIQWQNTPTTAKAKDHDRKLCSGSGIQSLSSPLMPKTTTAIVQNSPAKNITVERIFMANASLSVMKQSSMARVPITANKRNTKPRV